MLTFGESQIPPQKLAQELGARFVVDGLIESRGDTLYVSVQLADGWHGTQTFADALEVPVNAWHETAALVVGRLARALQFELNNFSTIVPAAADSAEIQARALSAQAWVQAFARPQAAQNNAEALALADRALIHAPRLAQAWVCQAFCDWRAGAYDWSDKPITELWPRALARIERAIELDPRDPDAHYVLGLVTLHLGQRLRAEEALRHCLRLAGSFAPAHGMMGLARQRRGFAAETAGHCDRAFALSPREPLRAIWHHAKADARFDLGDVQGAFEEAQRGMAVNANYPQNYVIGAAAAQRLGAHTQASAWVAELRERTAFNSVAALRERTMRTYEPAAIGSLESLIELLREAGLPVE
jgi:tetratricopeptide (TPR) repeat protein